MSEILKLEPAFKDYIWGGNRLKNEYGINNLDRVAEAWVCSCHKDGYSKVVNSRYLGKTLLETLNEWNLNGSEFYGSFPFLIKLIDAAGDLSIQVHPSDEYAKKVEGQQGKTEMWYILDAQEGAGIYYGFKNKISREDFNQKILSETLTEALNFVKVKKGDCFFIESGTIHAIGKGLLIAEIQQNSNVTYRVYDYGRLGADKKPRELHIEKALDVTRTEPVKKQPVFKTTDFDGGKLFTLAKCKYFTVYKLALKGSYTFINSGTFTSLLVVEGSGVINGIGSFTKNDCFFVPQSIKEVCIDGECVILITIA